jgi:HD-GYP domain-containing protein (c-di-GMP phosphodiesterase class II)/DNA-binding CsgD family transcriptional regulator
MLRRVTGDELRLAEPLAALSITTDLAMGQEPEKAVRTCVVAVHLARELDLPEATVRDVYYASLLQHLGCTAPNHEETYLSGDDLESRPQAERTDAGSPGEMLGLVAAVGRGTGARRVWYLARTLSAGKDGSRRIYRAICEVAAHMAERLRLGEEVRTALFHNIERWDGKGEPQGVSGEDVAVPARITAVATQAVIFDRLGGPDAAVEIVRRRSGGWFDPEVAEAFEQVGPSVLRHLDGADVWAEVLAVEPEPVRRIPDRDLTDVARAFGDLVDLKTPFTLGHSSGVADLAEGAAGALGLPEPAATGRAALLHDLGRVVVSNRVWEKPSTLTATEWEQVRLHPYHTQRILSRSTALEPLARPAGMHHERQDGSGYHHGAAGPEVPTVARVIAAADVFQAMTQDRPHRAALAQEAAAEAVMTEATDGGLDVECARAVLDAAGHRTRRPPGTWPAGLSDREVEVLRLVARGLSNKEVARQLSISARTAEHHIQHVYTKVGVSTRAAVALFAMEHDLMRR